LGSETGFPLWVEEKARIRAFFLSRSALSLFFALSCSFFRFALASAKARKKRRRPPLQYTLLISAVKNCRNFYYFLIGVKFPQAIPSRCKLSKKENFS
jgi:hypothetical protein